VEHLAPGFKNGSGCKGKPGQTLAYFASLLVMKKKMFYKILECCPWQAFPA
jgi:hypothetical protein